ncbi:hypothetical protein BKA62DRAFT_717731 [Auriculariales sp. MPI-PUGE-AT-0066]|nr:hypothetical protein BKA62DRAFT_717731 [Auriculariales sp. MPI-PUGE-AT-0066]
MYFLTPAPRSSALPCLALPCLARLPPRLHCPRYHTLAPSPPFFDKTTFLSSFLCPPLCVFVSRLRLRLSMTASLTPPALLLFIL